VHVSKGRIDRLGNSIRDGSMSEDDHLVLRVMRQKWEDTEAEFKNELIELFQQDQIEVFGRLKNFEGIKQKLSRSAFKLCRMRDIVGLRVIVPDGRRQQDELVQRIINEINGDRFKIIDRRIKPSAGYRAVHIEITRGVVIAEIQVRTELQHQWAFLVETLSLTVGGGIRYGEPPMVDHLNGKDRSLVTTAMQNFEELSFEIDQTEVFDITTSEIRRKLEIQKILINELQKGLG